MTRRLLAAVLALALAAVAAPSVASARITLTGDDSPALNNARYWAATSLMPTPNTTVRFTAGPGGGGCLGSTGCTWQDKDCGPNGPDWQECPTQTHLWIATDHESYRRSTFLHEVGHVFDLGMSQAARVRFQQIIGSRTGWGPAPDNLVTPMMMVETWAEAYMKCATQVRPHPSDLELAPYFFGYGYLPTRTQFRRVCGLVNREAARHGWTR